jgi:hypothetical protein
MEYAMPEDEQPYAAAPINRFRTSWYDLHLTSSFWRVTETTKSVHTFMKTPGAYAYASACAQVTPAMLEDAMLKIKQSGGKNSLQSVVADKTLPQQLRTAFSALHQSTASLIGSDGHRKLLQREGVAYTLRYGPPLIFATPNLADNKQRLLLVVQGEEIIFEADIQTSYREMTQRLANDPIGQAIVFELLIRLFFVHVLGIREELVGWKRGEACKPSQGWTSDGLAADFHAPWLFGLVAAAFGPVEAQGRGSLHPHILVWLLLITHRELLDLLLRDRDTFKERLRFWMMKVVEAAVATQETAVTELPRQMQGGVNRADVAVAPLPFGPNEKRYFAADGTTETATVEKLGVEADDGGEEMSLYFA